MNHYVYLTCPVFNAPDRRIHALRASSPEAAWAEALRRHRPGLLFTLDGEAYGLLGRAPSEDIFAQHAQALWCRAVVRELSEAAHRMLRDIAAGNGATGSLSGMSAHGGAVLTLTALCVRGLVTSDGEMTPEGQMVADWMKAGAK